MPKPKTQELTSEQVEFRMKQQRESDLYGGGVSLTDPGVPVPGEFGLMDSQAVPEGEWGGAPPRQPFMGLTPEGFEGVAAKIGTWGGQQDGPGTLGQQLLRGIGQSGIETVGGASQLFSGANLDGLPSPMGIGPFMPSQPITEGPTPEMIEGLKDRFVGKYQDMTGMGGRDMTTAESVGRFAGEAAQYIAPYGTGVGKLAMKAPGIGTRALAGGAVTAPVAMAREGVSPEAGTYTALGAAGDALLPPALKAAGRAAKAAGPALSKGTKMIVDGALEGSEQLAQFLRPGVNKIREVMEMSGPTARGYFNPELYPNISRLADETGGALVLDIVQLPWTLAARAGEKYTKWAQPFYDNIEEALYSPVQSEFIKSFDRVLASMTESWAKSPSIVSSIEATKKLFLSNYGIPKELLAMDRKRLGDLSEIRMNSINIMRQITDGVPAEHAYNFFRASEGVKEAGDMLPAELQNKVALYRRAVDDLQEEAYKSGLISKEILDAGFGNYHTRVGAYKKFAATHEIAPRLISSIGEADAKVVMDAARTGQHRKFIDLVDSLDGDVSLAAARLERSGVSPLDVDNLKRAYEGGHFPIIEHYAELQVLQKEFASSTSTKQRAVLKDLESMTRRRGMKEHKKVARADAETLMQTSSDYKIIRENADGTVDLMQDYPQVIREVVFGEMTNPAYRIANTYQKLSDAIVNTKYFQDVRSMFGVTNPESFAKNIKGLDDKISRVELELSTVLNSGKGAPVAYVKKRRAAMQDLVEQREMFRSKRQEVLDIISREDLVLVPDSKRKYGVMANTYAPREVAEYLTSTHDPKVFRGFLNDVYRYWKMGKIVYNPATQFRNVMGNAVLADTEDVIVRDYLDAARLMKAEGRGEEVSGILKALAKTGHGIRGTGYFDAEVKAASAMADSMGGANHQLGVPPDVAARSTMKIMKQLVEAPQKAYQLTEDYFKMTVAMAKLRQMGYPLGKGATDEAIDKAAETAAHAIFDYGIKPPYLKGLTEGPLASTAGSPFGTFSYKALARSGELLVTKPWKIAKWMLYGKGLETAIQWQYGLSSEEMAAVNQGAGFVRNPGGVPTRHHMLPLTREIEMSDGTTKDSFSFLDTSFIVGLTDLLGNTSAILPGNAPVLRSLLDIQNNSVNFTNPIINAVGKAIGAEYSDPYSPAIMPGSPSAKQALLGDDKTPGIGGHLFRQAMPSVLAYQLPKAVAAAKGHEDWKGHIRKPIDVALDMVGLKTGYHDKANIGIQISKIEEGIRKQNASISRAERDPNISEAEKTKVIAEAENRIERLYKAIERLDARYTDFETAEDKIQKRPFEHRRGME